MGSLLELNDTLLLTTEQGFPAAVFDLERHRRRPIDIAEVADQIFAFEGKLGPRFFHLDPVRVFLVQNIDGKWLPWGHVVIVEQHIQRARTNDRRSGSPASASEVPPWVTSGKYRVVKVYDPAYQVACSPYETPPGCAYLRTE